MTVTWLSPDTSSHFSCTLSLVAWCLLSNLVTFFVLDNTPPPWALGWTSSILPTSLHSYLLYKVLAVKHQWRGECHGDEASISDLLIITVDSFSLYPDDLDTQVTWVILHVPFLTIHHAPLRHVILLSYVVYYCIVMLVDACSAPQSSAVDRSQMVRAWCDS